MTSPVVDAQVIGDGLLPETTMGPINNAKQLKVVTNMIAEARAAGQDVHELGQVPDQELYQQGYFQRPVLVLNADVSLSVVRQEQFGPILPIIPFETETDAIAMANDDPFGLASSIWTADTDRAVTLARQIEAGYTFINAHGPSGWTTMVPLVALRSRVSDAISDTKGLRNSKGCIQSLADRARFCKKTSRHITVEECQ